MERRQTFPLVLSAWLDTPGVIWTVRGAVTGCGSWRLTDIIRTRGSVDAIVVTGTISQTHPSVVPCTNHIWHIWHFQVIWNFDHVHVFWCFWLWCTSRLSWAARVGIARVTRHRWRHLATGSFPARMREAAVPGNVTSSQTDLTRAVPDFGTDVGARTICVRFTPDRATVLKVNNVTLILKFKNLHRWVNITSFYRTFGCPIICTDTYSQYYCGH